ncbi:MAG: hypothetical protein EBZ69_05250 [Alphaproteobacteria bacterium]|nr:hypothetical protein [Pseudomonadota bacterium]NBX74756.1 hypothetical protein [Alphaproteobacteria bacterium]NDC56200.1 hypothetical protein [Alphaproteobacteria bacterium]NDG04623.1 hypothetical protein [Alphaproteobacteria bacterium]
MHEVIFEAKRTGNIIRLVAMDTQTLTEVVVQGPANVRMQDLEQLALKKLEYVLKKKSEKS